MSTSGPATRYDSTCRSEHARRVHACKIKMTVTGIFLLGCTKLRLTAEFLGARDMFSVFCTPGHVYCRDISKNVAGPKNHKSRFEWPTHSWTPSIVLDLVLVVVVSFSTLDVLQLLCVLMRKTTVVGPLARPYLKSTGWPIQNSACARRQPAGSQAASWPAARLGRGPERHSYRIA